MKGLPGFLDVNSDLQITSPQVLVEIDREKAVAAHRHHIAHVIVPHANTKDLAELPPDVKEGEYVVVHVGFAIALRGGGLVAPAVHDE